MQSFHYFDAVRTRQPHSGVVPVTLLSDHRNPKQAGLVVERARIT